jgi:hypothetical protein
LAACGINIIPDEQCGKHFNEIVTGKDYQFERKWYREMSELVPSFSFCYSKWNNQKHFEKKIVFGIKETLHYSNSTSHPTTKSNSGATDLPLVEPDTVDSTNNNVGSEDSRKSGWSTCLYQERSCILIKATELSKYTEELTEGAKVCP